MTTPPTPHRVDVAIPVYGTPEYLAEAMESVLAQTWQDFRLTIYQNGPGEEETRAVVDRYAGDERISYAPAGTTLTAGENWTRCVRGGEAPYIAMLHEDDRYEPEFLERRVRFLDAHPACGFVFSSMRDINEQGRELWSYPYRLAEGEHAPRAFAPLLLAEMIVGSPTSLVRRDAYEEAGATFTDDLINRDWEMWLRIALRRPTGYLAVRDCERRVHRGSVTSGLSRWGEENLRLVDRFEALVAELLPDVEWPERDRRRRRADGHLTEAINAIAAEDPNDARRHLRAALEQGPAVAADPRFPAALIALSAGPRGRRAIVVWRARRGQQRWAMNAIGLRRLGRDLLLRATRG